MPRQTSIHLRGDSAQSASFINVSGEIDTSTARAFREQLFSGISGNDIQYVIVRLKHVPYMDSSGIAVLLELFKATRKKHLRLSLLEPSEAVRQALGMVDFEALTPVYSTIRECAECTGIGISSLRSGLELNDRESLPASTNSSRASVRESSRAG